PYAVVLTGYFVASVVEPAIIKHQLILSYSPYLLLGFVALLSFHFNRGCVLLVTLAVGIAYWGLQLSSSQAFSRQLATILSVLMPISLVLVAFIRERGIFTWLNYGLLSVFILQMLAVVWLFQHPDSPFWLFLRKELFPFKSLSGIRLAQPGMACILMASLVLSLLCYLRRTPFNNALLAILLAVSLSLNNDGSATIQLLMFSLVGGILLVSLLQDSYHMAYRDELTGLMGRRALNEAMQKLGHRYVIAMLDVDRFKKFNDTHGHDVGDQVLKMVASHLTKATGGGKPYRYGGEEFALVFPRRKIAQVKPHLEALRQSIADYGMTIRDTQRPKDKKEGMKQRTRKKQKTTVKVTVSVGAAERDETLKTPGLVIKAADESLYQAKRKGRNKVICG
ncbi:MAG: GGDEF domain-containing protein, partial [Pseudomonadales bacterium]|nr:GGDEF domain-containing protein [Pseudomonadales bacterium]